MPPRIAVVGSLMMDLVVRAPRLPRAGESLLSHSFQTLPGGKGGNQAIAAARLGADVTMIGQVGRDRFGEIVGNSLSEARVDTSFIAVDESIGTGVAVPIVVDDGENAILAVPQANLSLSPTVIERARAAIERADALLLQFEVGMEANLAAARIAVRANVPVFLNPAPVAEHPAELVALATAIVPNEVEAAALVPAAGGDHGSELEVLSRLADWAVITLGEQGSIGRRGEECAQVSAFKVETVDSVGAGDAFCAAFALAGLQGLPLADCLRFANAAGALATTCPGAQAGLPRLGAVEDMLRGR